MDLRSIPTRRPSPEFVEDVFRTMLDVGVTWPAPESKPTPLCMTATVHFASAWDGAVLLQCTEKQVRTFAVRLMPTLDTIEAEDLRDTLGELANMVGGNLKTTLPPGVALSMPSVVLGNQHEFQVWRKGLTQTVTFASDLGDFW